MFVNYACFDEIDRHELSLCYDKLKLFAFFTSVNACVFSEIVFFIIVLCTTTKIFN